MAPRTDFSRLWAAGDELGLLELGRTEPAAAMRFLVGRLYAVDPQEMHRAVAAIGRLVAIPNLVSPAKLVDLVRRFIWALSDESGAVPFGNAEAFGEVLAQRPELRPEFLPLLGAYLTTESMHQTGPIEQGVIWALGRVGPPVMQRCPAAVKALEYLSHAGLDEATRQAARAALERIRRAPA